MMPHTSWQPGARLTSSRLPYVTRLGRLLGGLAPEGTLGRSSQDLPSSESRLRELVAEHLGVDADELRPEVSLTDDLAADSLDLVELGLAIEEELNLTLPESVLTDVRTYGELAAAVGTLDRERSAPEPSTEMPAYFSARIMPARAHAHGDRHHGGWLTPYSAQAIVEDALGEGRGARLEVTVSSHLSSVRLARLLDQFAPLGERGVEVSVRRDDPAGVDYPDAAA